MIIDAKDKVLGRLAAYVAKQALLGEKIDIINSEKAIVTGSRSEIFAKYKAKYNRGVPLQGPYVSRLPERMVKRTIRGMLPYKQPKGKEAFERIKCHRGVPKGLEKADDIKLQGKEKLSITKYVTMHDICKELGAKI